MRLDDRKTSDNVDDRRGEKTSGKISLSIGGTILIGLIIWLVGGNNPMEFMTQQATDIISLEKTYIPSAQEESAANFAKTIFVGKEDVWADRFPQNGLKYIAPEVGYHIQYLPGMLQKGQQKQQLTEKESNELNVRFELQADFYAEVWVCHDNEKFNSFEEGDIEKGLNAASKTADDQLQIQLQRCTVPETFNHGTSAQRIRWLKKGLPTGDIQDGNTFDIPYKQL